MSSTWENTIAEGLRLAELRGLEYSDAESTKTNLTRCAVELGIDRMEPRTMSDDALTVERADGNFTLFVNAEHPRIRHRFSVAHEISHLLLKPVLGDKVAHRRRFVPHQDPDGQRIETLCDNMASHMLMPQQRLMRIIDQTGWSAACVPGIARIFDVSFEAAARRYANLYPEPCAIRFRRIGRDGNPSDYRSNIVNESMKVAKLDLGAASRGHLDADKAFRTDDMVTSREAILVSRPRGRRKVVKNMPEVKVESFGRGRSAYRTVYSFIYIPASTT